jgi:two-component system, NtrC family, sensor kinase
LRVIELKQHLVEVADDLSNIMLEIRRYEKNYLLYGSAEDLAENQRYIQLGLEVLDNLEPEVKGFKGAPQVSLIRQHFSDYHNLLKKITSNGTALSPSSRRELEEQLRERGKQLVELSHQLVKIERQRILEIIMTLKTQLVTAIFIFCFWGDFWLSW